MVDFFFDEFFNYGETFELWVNFWNIDDHFIDPPPITQALCQRPIKDWKKVKNAYFLTISVLPFYLYVRL